MLLLSFEIAKFGLALAFLFYGYECLAAPKMFREFERYGMPKIRPLIGWLEISGGLGILVGYLFPVIGLLATGGLALLMLGGVVLRIAIKDKATEIVPAAFFLFTASAILWVSLT